MSTNLILIDSNLKDTDVLLSALNAQTTGILYNYDTSRNTILNQIDATFSVKAIERVAICCHGGVNQFLENGNFFDLDVSSNEVIKNENTQVIFDILNDYSVSNIDFLSCNSLKYESWRKFYDLIENEVEGVTVGASEDETGNMKYGGNWVMEHTGEAIDTIYFNEGVKYYTYLLVGSTPNTDEEIINPPNSSRFMSYVLEGGYWQHWLSELYQQWIWISSSENDISIHNGTDLYIDGSNIEFNYLEIDLGTNTPLSGVISQGRDNGQYITSYRVRYNLQSYNGSSWVIIAPSSEDSAGNNRFVANSNGSDFRISRFNSLIITDKIRIYPTSGNQYLSARFGLIQYNGTISSTLNPFTISPSNITVENHGTINMTFSNNIITNTDISNSLTVDPLNAGIIDNITGSGTDWSANFVPNYGLDLTDCSLNFNHSTYGINEYSNTFNVDTMIEILDILDFSLTPSILLNTDVSATLRIEFDKTVSSPSNFNFTLDPSYIATLGPMSDVSSGFVWEGTLTRTPNMNKLENKLDFNFPYNGVEVSANLVYDVVENSELINKKWNFSNSDIINQGFSKQMQMSPNGLLMGFIDGSNVEIYRKSESSNWVTDVSYNCHSFALTNNHIILANETMLEIYDYSGSSWSIMNGGNIAYLNVIALSINVDGTYVAVSNNADVKVLQNISDNWTHINTYNNGSVIGLSLSPNGLKLGIGIGTVGQDYSSIMVEDVVNNDPPVITLVGDAIINHEVNTAYTDLGATANDNFYGDITGIIITNNNVDTSTLGGTYTITYDVSNSNNISAIQKIRTVNVIDTTPPIVVLNGDAVVTLTIGDTYTELGATASDNSLESLTVTISGDFVNTSIIDDYTLTYSATDSTGNNHSIGRLIHIVTPSLNYELKWTHIMNSISVDIFQQLDFFNKLSAQPTSTLSNFSVSGQAVSVMNGSYECEWSSYESVGAQHQPYVIYGATTLIASGGQKEWIAKNGQTFNHHIHGSTTLNGTLYNSYGIYQGPSSTSVGGYTGFQSQLATNSNTYNGEFASVTFPFYFELKGFYVSLNYLFKYVPCKVTILGSNDDGATYDFIHTSSLVHNTISYHDVDISSNTAKFKKYKIVFEETQTNMTELHVEFLRFYGDVYELV